jgi:hypothetical protein
LDAMMEDAAVAVLSRIVPCLVIFLAAMAL